MKLLRELKNKKNVTYIAVDIETDFYPPKAVFEVGASWWSGNSETVDKVSAETYHWIIKEYQWKHNNPVFKNGEYNHKNDFFGKSRDPDKSEHISNRHVADRLMWWIRDLEQRGEVVLILHGGKSDLVNLAELGCKIDHLKVLDTQLIDLGLYWESCSRVRQRQSLGNLLHTVGHPLQANIPMHNAGNDAFYTMMAFVRLMEIAK